MYPNCSIDIQRNCFFNNACSDKSQIVIVVELINSFRSTIIVMLLQLYDNFQIVRRAGHGLLSDDLVRNRHILG